MRAAHDDLVRGARAKAILELELARSALKTCQRLHAGSREALASAN